MDYILYDKGMLFGRIVFRKIFVEKKSSVVYIRGVVAIKKEG